MSPWIFLECVAWYVTGALNEGEYVFPEMDSPHHADVGSQSCIQWYCWYEANRRRLVWGHWPYIFRPFITTLVTIGKAYSMAIGHRHDMRIWEYRKK